MQNKILGIIPARYAATRFPGKVLVDIQGKPMIQRVYEQTKKSQLLTDVIIATDDERVKKVAEGFGARVFMTDPEHPSGTDRCYEALRAYQGTSRQVIDFVVNIQGDEPFIQPEQIDCLAALLDDSELELATLIHKIKDKSDLQNPNVVKVTASKGGKALYFSRSAIPFTRNQTSMDFYRHIGMYAYRADVLEKITQLPASPLEQTEGLEQLRWLENDFTIRVALTDLMSRGIDTPQDLEGLL
ncbi:MAG: 3-deoxy-manno-octulosonate cytidylyltransferase [Bacteroidota bacterium]